MWWLTWAWCALHWMLGFGRRFMHGTSCFGPDSEGYNLLSHPGCVSPAAETQTSALSLDAGVTLWLYCSGTNKDSVIWKQLCKGHRILERFGLSGTLNIILFQSLCYGQGAFAQDQVAQIEPSNRNRASTAYLHRAACCKGLGTRNLRKGALFYNSL